MKQKLLISIFLLVVLVLVFILFNLKSALINNQEDYIKIGNIGILSGQGSSWGIAAKNSIDLAVEEINKTGGINGKILIVDHQDDKGISKEAINAFNNLTDIKNINVIIGTTWSTTGIPLIDLANNKEVLMISPSLGKAEFNESSKYLFNTWPHDFVLSQNLADYVYNKGYRSVALIGAEEIWVKDQTNAFTNRFEELGGKVLVVVEPLPTQVDIYSDALKIKSTTGVEAIISTTDGVLVGSRVAKSLKEMGVNSPIYSITIDKDSIDAAQGAYEGMEFLTFLDSTPEFRDIYEKKYNQTIDVGGPSAYDAVMMIAKAMKETGSEDPEVLQAYLHNIKEWDGASGHLVSDGKGGFTKEYKIMKVVDGKIVSIS